VARFIALYPRPDDVDGFEQHMSEVHLPLVERWPDADAVTVSRVTGTPRGADAPYHLVVTVDYPDDDTMRASLVSEPAREAGKDAMGLAERFDIQPVLLLATDA
jgi:uncharacterized protein (TIGR02118 family)